MQSILDEIFKNYNPECENRRNEWFIKRGNQFIRKYRIAQMPVHEKPVLLECTITGCEYSTYDYKEFFRHLRKVHKFRYMKLPGNLVKAIEKSGKPG